MKELLELYCSKLGENYYSNSIFIFYYNSLTNIVELQHDNLEHYIHDFESVEKLEMFLKSLI